MEIKHGNDPLFNDIAPKNDPPKSKMHSVHARMAELVDALVSNTSEAIRAGSIPAPGTMKIANCLLIK